MIITISGTPGSGKGTVGRMLAKKLHYRYYSIGNIRRAMARERGMTLQQFNVYGERHGFTDTRVDNWQAKLGRTQDNFVVEGRTGFHFIPHSVKVLFIADLHVAAKRIFKDRAHARQFEASTEYRTPRELEHGLRNRIASDTRRYRKYYGINIFLKRHYDLVIDTTNITPKQTSEKILSFLANPVRGSRAKGKFQVSRRILKAVASNGAKIKQKSEKVEKRGIKRSQLEKKKRRKSKPRKH